MREKRQSVQRSVVREERSYEVAAAAARWREEDRVSACAQFTLSSANVTKEARERERESLIYKCFIPARDAARALLPPHITLH